MRSFGMFHTNTQFLINDGLKSRRVTFEGFVQYRYWKILEFQVTFSRPGKSWNQT